MPFSLIGGLISQSGNNSAGSAAQGAGATAYGQANNAAERARSAVSKRIHAEVKRIRRAHPALGRHLGATITTGYFCAYQPQRDVVVKWEL